MATNIKPEIHTAFRWIPAKYIRLAIYQHSERASLFITISKLCVHMHHHFTNSHSQNMQETYSPNTLLSTFSRLTRWTWNNINWPIRFQETHMLENANASHLKRFYIPVSGNTIMKQTHKTCHNWKNRKALSTMYVSVEWDDYNKFKKWKWTLILKRGTVR